LTTGDDEKLRALIDACVGLLEVGLALSCPRSANGSFHPTEEQIGWAFGLCEASVQDLSLSDAETLAFTSIVFEQVFSPSGAKFVRDIVDDQASFLASIQEGGDAFLEWASTKKPPLPPLAT
jgi:hypothetical protein